ncbi:oligopeptidase A [Blochmannia endosymbiont of Colobopsis nipponica]|uniref:M3 family metallopeptidase n=1 Tax=Blochmannia endosymbiont of Colobopsis nipponica TaxID=2681987 RepID=UPI0017854AFA|nr:M3 family metallopeptidase [Blochmannia endosymbiont of Colobopsis nipponica]QOI10823.1 oligopeptidase A [Blochmannia endosymbiont of Colobopsis nipponica]
MINSLLLSYKLPPFSSIRIKDGVSAMRNVLNYCYNNVEQVLTKSSSFKWETLHQPLAIAENKLKCVWSPIVHLNSVQNSEITRKVYEECLLLLVEYKNWFSQHSGLYSAYYNLRNGSFYSQLNSFQRKVINNILRDFKLSGMTLSANKQKRYREIVFRLSELSVVYNNNVIDATINWKKLVFDKDLLLGMPQRDIDEARFRAHVCGLNGWLLTLQNPFYSSLMTYCENKFLREECYLAYHTRASHKGPNAGKWDNGPIINEILILRHELSLLLGFDSYIDKVLFTKMINNPNQVLCFLNKLIPSIKAQGEKEWHQLKSFVKKFFGYKTLYPWDIAFYKEKEKQFLFCFNDEQLSNYFPESKVINGMFEVVRRVYGIKIKKRNDVDVWYPDVQFFDVFTEHDNQYEGGFYLDLHVRSNKCDGAWMDECTSAFHTDNIRQDPVAYLVCNFHRSIDNQETLLTHSEVLTLFHEFGHVLHHIMTRINIPEISGINGVPHDVIELPSQLMEFFCWDVDVLELISSHYKTGESLSKELCKNLIASRNYQSASYMLNQIIYSLFDFHIHYKFLPKTISQFMSILVNIKNQISLLPSINDDYFPHTFNHIFTNNYGGGYYGYLWSNVLAANVWSLFEARGVFDYMTGKSFLDNILATGGSEDPMDMFIRVYGCKPNINIMLKYNGILTSSN